MRSYGIPNCSETIRRTRSAVSREVPAEHLDLQAVAVGHADAADDRADDADEALIGTA